MARAAARAGGAARGMGFAGLVLARFIWSTQVTMKSVAISTFKAQCLALLEDVARTGKPLLVTKRGKPLARLVAADHSGSSFPQDTLRHSVETLGDVIAPAIPATAWDATRGVVLAQDDGRAVRTRRRRQAGLVTSDARIIDSKLVRTIW